VCPSACAYRLAVALLSGVAPVGAWLALLATGLGRAGVAAAAAAAAVGIGCSSGRMSGSERLPMAARRTPSPLALVRRLREPGGAPPLAPPCWERLR
jgi:hypothetical protein